MLPEDAPLRYCIYAHNVTAYRLCRVNAFTSRNIVALTAQKSLLTIKSHTEETGFLSLALQVPDSILNFEPDYWHG